MDSSDKQPDKQQGIEESQQDRKQDEVAKQRPGQQDEKIRDAHDRGPPRQGDGAE